MAISKAYLLEQIKVCEKSLATIEEGKFINESLLSVLKKEYAQISTNKGSK